MQLKPQGMGNTGESAAAKKYFQLYLVNSKTAHCLLLVSVKLCCLCDCNTCIPSRHWNCKCKTVPM